MIIPIVVDTETIASQFAQITPDQINALCDNVAKGLAAAYAAQLELEAQAELHTTLSRYKKAIKVIDTGKMEGTVLLDYSKDPMVKMIEEGATPFDMKEGFMKSAKIKIGKNGKRYLTIPYRIANPNAVAESDVFAFKMPSSVYKIVKNIVPTIPVAGGGMRSAGLKIADLPKALQTKQIRPAISAPEGNVLFKEYQHKSALYEGLIKRQDSVTGQNTYGTFRRVSENSDDDAWIHPGIQKHNLIQKALSNFQTGEQMTDLVDSELSKLGLI